MVAREDIVAWALQAGLEERPHGDLLAGYCGRLVDAGVPLWRAAIGTSRLHPLLIAQGHNWVAGEGVRDEFYAREDAHDSEDEWPLSPWYRLVHDNKYQMRCRIGIGEGTNEFPLLRRLAEDGGSDYWARVLAFRPPNERLEEKFGLASSWTTRAADGFADGDLALIEDTLPAFALAFKATLAVDTAQVLTTTYLGREAAERILRGEIDRGQVRTLRKVLWFSDLTGFTRIADTLPRDQLLDLLNAYADCLVGVVHDHQGEVMKFMGDGILAVFGGERSEACARALDAALAARAAIVRLNRERGEQPVTGFTLALHEGEVYSGNIGSRDRLDFTVVGPAVNELARIQAMSRSLDQPMLVSASFAEACTRQRDRLVSVGRYALRGVGQPQELFTLDLTGA